MSLLSDFFCCHQDLRCISRVHRIFNKLQKNNTNVRAVSKRSEKIEQPKNKQGVYLVHLTDQLWAKNILNLVKSIENYFFANKQLNLTLMFGGLIQLALLKTWNKNCWVDRNTEFTHSRNTWKLTPIFLNYFINQSIIEMFLERLTRR